MPGDLPALTGGAVSSGLPSMSVSSALQELVGTARNPAANETVLSDVTVHKENKIKQFSDKMVTGCDLFTGVKLWLD